MTAREVRLTGSSRGEDLTTTSCAATVRAGAGQDTIRAVSPARRSPAFPITCAHAVGGRLHGDAGDDVLTGGRRADLLVGGPGSDTARGLGGRDSCRAERESGCER